jgi:hypothetical protein
LALRSRRWSLETPCESRSRGLESWPTSSYPSV